MDINRLTKIKEKVVNLMQSGNQFVVHNASPSL